MTKPEGIQETHLYSSFGFRHSFGFLVSSFGLPQTAIPNAAPVSNRPDSQHPLASLQSQARVCWRDVMSNELSKSPKPMVPSATPRRVAWSFFDYFWFVFKNVLGWIFILGSPGIGIVLP